MAKLLRGKDRLLLALSLIGDTLEMVIGGGASAYHYRRLGLYFPPGYKQTNLYTAVSKTLKTGDIEKITDSKGKTYLQLSSTGKTHLLRKFPLIKIQQKHWDKIWRLVTFDIPEKSKTKRDLLRQKLLSLGFAQLQKSAYISPHNISQDLVEFLEQNNLLGQAWLLEVKHKYLPPAKTFANRLWPLEKINQEYSILIEKLQTAKLNEPKLKKIINQYLLLLAQDPHLPFDLLPKTWAEPELRRLINKFTFLKRTRSRIN